MRFFMRKYRIVKDDYSGFEVQCKRWWFPGYWQCGDGRNRGCNTHGSLEAAKEFIIRYDKIGNSFWRGDMVSLTAERLGVKDVSDG